MKKSLQRLVLLVVLAISTATSASAQLNGVYTIGGASPNYPTLSSAITALNVLGVSGPVTFNIRTGSYSGSNWQGQINTVTGASATNRITFRAESGNKADVTINVAGSASANYIFRLNSANFITIRDLSLVNTNTTYGHSLDFVGLASNDSVLNCNITGPTSTSTSSDPAAIFANGHTGDNIVFYRNTVINGSSWAWWYGSGTSSHTNNVKFIENTFNMTSSGYYGFRSYYSNNLKLIKNTFNYTGTGIFYANFIYYADNDMNILENTYTLSSTTTLYGLYLYYPNYYAANASADSRVEKNVVNLTNTSGSSYCMYNYYGLNFKVLDNKFNSTSTTGAHYVYGIYYCNSSVAKYNEYNIKGTSSATIYADYLAYNSGNFPNDTFSENIVNMSTVGGTINNYMGYYGPTIVEKNTYITSNTTGTTNNHVRYGSGMHVRNNKIVSTSTTGAIYGLYVYNTTSYSGANVYNNDVDISSTGTATHYAMYTNYMNNDKVYNNLITNKTSGTSYSLYLDAYNTKGFIFNNTFHSYSTGATQYGVYYTGGDVTLHSNIFTRTNSASSGWAVYATATGSLKSDYNLYDVPGGNMFYSSAYSGTSLNSWREKTGFDKNSLVYTVPYIDAASRNFNINPSSSAAWAVNGRAFHDTARHTDIAGTLAPRFPANGVPDIGAYEVSPTSTPPNAIATPANPVANSRQVFTFGQDTVMSIDWGSSVPSTYTVRQYTGLKANPVPAGLQRMYFYVAGTPATWMHTYKANVYYKDPWVGDIPNETSAVLARSSNNGAWEGYNYTNAATDDIRNILSTVGTIDSVGSYTGVLNGRIGIRCINAPTGIRISNITAFNADIDWDAIYNPLGYQVVVKTSNSAPTQAEWNASAFPATNSLSAGGLSEYTKYYVFIRNVCGVKDTSGYTMDSFMTIITCHAPVVSISSLNSDRAVVAWDTVFTATHYDFALTTSPVPPTAGTALYKTNQLVSFLDNNKSYYAHVRANCNSIYAKSDWTTVEFKTWKTSVGSVASENGISIYPNPVSDEMVINIDGATKTGTIVILDMTGKQLKSEVINGGNATVKVNELPAGFYILQYLSDGQRGQVKFAKQ